MVLKVVLPEKNWNRLQTTNPTCHSPRVSKIGDHCPSALNNPTFPHSSRNLRKYSRVYNPKNSHVKCQLKIQLTRKPPRKYLTNLLATSADSSAILTHWKIQWFSELVCNFHSWFPGGFSFQQSRCHVTSVSPFVSKNPYKVKFYRWMVESSDRWVSWWNSMKWTWVVIVLSAACVYAIKQPWRWFCGRCGCWLMVIRSDMMSRKPPTLACSG